MKIKVTLETKAAKKVLVAAGFSGIDVINSEVVNPKKSAFTLQVSKGEDLLEMGQYLSSLTDEEVKSELERREKLAKEKEAKKK